MTSPSRYHLRIALVSAAIVLTIMTTATQAAWEAVPEASLTTESYDDVVLDTANEESATRYVLDAGVTFANVTERGSLVIAPRAVTDAYADSSNDSFESDDFFFDAGGQYRWQNVAMGFQSSYSEQSVLRAEFAGALPDDPDIDPVDVDSGRSGVAGETRERARFQADLDFRLSERSVLRFELQHLDVAYSTTSALLTGRSDFDNTALSTQLIHDIDDRSQLIARTTVAQFRSDRLDNHTKSVGVEGVFTRALSETWRLSLFAGVQESAFDLIDPGTQTRIDASETNFPFGIGFRKRSERSIFNVDLIRQVIPNSSGFVIARDEARAYLQQQFTPRWTGRFGVRYSRSQEIHRSAAAAFVGRDYARLELSFERAMTRTVFLNFGLDSRRQEFENEPNGSTTSNSVFLGVVYRGLSRRPQ